MLPDVGVTAPQETVNGVRMDKVCPVREAGDHRARSPHTLAPTPPPPVVPSRHWYVRWKRGAEFLLALVLLVPGIPLILLAALLVKLTSRGPALYTQTRLGLNNKPFTLYKVRSMFHDCEKQSGIRWSLPGDPRVTRVGRVLRQLHLDELPQLWNVLRGDMSLVGPRPERPEFTPELEKAVPGYRERLRVRPGVTGLAQVQLPPDTDLTSVRTKLAYDLYYIRHLRLWLDLRILLCTAVQVLGVAAPLAGRWFAIPSRIDVERSMLAAAGREAPAQTNARAS
jgi:lipopolysaccharide/colanic/teichoic acid biosynthesis glycosyltransferase